MSTPSVLKKMHAVILEENILVNFFFKWRTLEKSTWNPGWYEWTGMIYGGAAGDPLSFDGDFLSVRRNTAQGANYKKNLKIILRCDNNLR